MFKVYYDNNQVKKALLLLIMMLLLKSFNLFSQTINTSNRSDTILFSDFLSTPNRTDTVSINYKENFFEFLKILKCLSGTVYFSGDGFSSAVILECTASQAKLKICFDRCVPGSKCTLDNCAIYRDGGQKPVLVNKVVLFQ